MKKFTLVELVVSIVVLGILLSIVLINFFDLKKKAVQSSMNQNISILQGEVDTFYLKKEKYPIKNDSLLSLENPQLIDIEQLVQNGFQKKNLDTSKIKNQYYWVDVFGKVWGSTENNLGGINLLEKDNSYILEGILGEGSLGYNLYEVLGYSSSIGDFNNLVSDNQEKTRYYKLKETYALNESKETYIQHPFTNAKATYLFSTIDQYGLESAPKGKFAYDTQFPSIIRGEGEYEFEIAGGDVMYWIDFITLQDTPGKSTITYKFTVKDSEGAYVEEWTDDYFSLDPSKGIKVKVTMKGDDEGNKPSLYDLRIIFKYADEETPPTLIPEPEDEDEKEALCLKHSTSSTFNPYSTNLNYGMTGSMVYHFKVNDLETIEETFVPQVLLGNNIKFEILNTELFIEVNGSFEPYTNQDTSGKCMVVIYEIKITSFKEPTIPQEVKQLCGSNGTKTSLNYQVGNKKTSRIVYSTYLEKGQFLTKIDKPSTPNGSVFKLMFIEVSHKGSDFQKISSISEVQDESCVNIVFIFENLLGYPPPPEVNTCTGAGCQPVTCEVNCNPICTGCDPDKGDPTGGDSVPNEKTFCELNPAHENCKTFCLQHQDECIPDFCEVNCTKNPPTKPTEGDPELKDPEWTTVDTLRFFGHGAQSQLTRWYKSEHSDSIVEAVNSDEISLSVDTRIVYRYAKSNGNSWTSQYKDFATTGIASSVMGIAYVQVRTSELDKVLEADYPTVKSMRFYNEQGFLDMSMVQPTLTILVGKDNNGTRNVYSDESNITWDYVAADPRNKKITDIEWGGDKRDKYPVGTYEVKARVKNEVEIWSEWVTVKLEVLQEKPIAKISIRSNGDLAFPNSKDKFTWSLGESKDPDGDKLVAVEWKNNKATYDKGTHIVSLRVQDSEGYWSNWDTYTLTIGDPAYKIFRLEAEDNYNELVTGRFGTVDNTKVLSNQNASNGLTRGVKTAGFYIDFTFTGTGFYLKILNAADTRVIILNEENKTFDYDKKGPVDLQVHNLELKTHTVRVMKTGDNISGYGNTSIDVDYLDVFSIEDKASVISYSSNITDSNKKILQSGSTFSSRLNQNLELNYAVRTDSYVTAEVLDSKGKVVQTLFKEVLKDGGSLNKQRHYWNGLDSNGNHLKTGNYSIKTTQKGIHFGTISTHSYPIRLNNDSPVYRIEAEHTNANLISGVFGSSVNSKITDIANASNGKVRSIKTSNHYIQFDFEGTGFDLALFNAYQSNVRLVGHDSFDINLNSSKSSEFLSLRNLPFNKYTLIVTKLGTNQSHYGTLDLEVDYLDVYQDSDKPSLLSLKTNIVTPEGYVMQEDNSFSSKNGTKFRFTYQVRKDRTTTIQLLNSKGALISTLKEDEPEKGGSLDNYIYDFTGVVNENHLETGDYKMKFIFEGINSGEIETVVYDFKVDNADRVERLEAELVNGTSITGRFGNGTNSRLTSAAKYSNGRMREIKTNGYYQTFNFTGTGFDLQLPNVYYARVEIIGPETYTYEFGSSKTKRTVSYRDMVEGDYTVKITKYGTNQSSFELLAVQIDYLDYFQ